MRVGWHEFRGLQANLRVLKLLGEPKVGYSAYFAGVGEQLPKADPTRFTIYEGWDSKDTLERHLKSACFQDTVAKMGDLVAERDKDGTPFIGEPLTMLADRSDAA